MENKTNLSLMQWNILSKSELYCSNSSFPKIEEKFLNFTYRKDLFIEIFNKFASDIICLQEVDDFEEFKTNILSLYKYDSVYYKKDEGIQGIAIFYDKGKLNLLYHQNVNLPKDDRGTLSNQFFVFCFFEEKISKKIICLITTHLKSKTEFEQIRISQIKYLLNYSDRNEEFLELYYKYLPTGILFCGDFNAEPDYSCINYLKYFKYGKNKLLLGKGFKSAYNVWDKEKEDHLEMTTFKIRDRPYYRVIDYIMYTDPIQCNFTTPTLKLCDQKFINTDLEKSGLPCEWFPSDHYYLTMNFSL